MRATQDVTEDVAFCTDCEKQMYGDGGTAAATARRHAESKGHRTYSATTIVRQYNPAEPRPQEGR